MDALITIKDLSVHMGLPEELADESKAVLKAAIRASQLHLEQVLKSKLLTDTYEDKWLLAADINNGVMPRNVFTLITSTGLIKADSLSLSYADDRWETSWTTMTSGTDYVADLELGRIEVHSEFDGSWVKAAYTAGYEAGDTLPEWLREAIISLTPIIQTFGAEALRQKDAAPNVKAAVDHVMTVASQHSRRNYGIVYRPS